MSQLLFISTITSFIVGLCYGKSKTLANRLRLTLSIILTLTLVRVVYLIAPYVNIKDPLETSQIQSSLISLVAYFLVASITVCFFAWKKRGFKNLNEFTDTTHTGIISELTYTTIGAIIFGIPAGLFTRASGLQFTGGFAIGLVLWFIVGVSKGFKKEFGTSE